MIEELIFPMKITRSQSEYIVQKEKPFTDHQQLFISMADGLSPEGMKLMMQLSVNWPMLQDLLSFL